MDVHRAGSIVLVLVLANPGTGGFVSQDSYAGNSSNPVSLNKYLYADVNPLMGVDPSGRMTLRDLAGAVALVAVTSALAYTYISQHFLPTRTVAVDFGEISGPLDKIYSKIVSYYAGIGIKFYRGSCNGIERCIKFRNSEGLNLWGTTLGSTPFRTANIYYVAIKQDYLIEVLNMESVLVDLSATVAAHELAHSYGLRHEGPNLFNLYSGEKQNSNIMNEDISGGIVDQNVMSFSPEAKNKLISEVAKAR